MKGQESHPPQERREEDLSMGRRESRTLTTSSGPGPQDTLPFNQRTQGQERQWSHTDRWLWQDTSERKCWHKKCKVAYKVAQTWLVSRKATVPSHRRLKNGLLIPTDYNEGKHSCPSVSNCAINTRVWGQITSGRLRSGGQGTAGRETSCTTGALAAPRKTNLPYLLRAAASTQPSDLAGTSPCRPTITNIPGYSSYHSEGKTEENVEVCQ